MGKIAIMANNTYQKWLKTSKKKKNNLYNIYCQYFGVSGCHVASRQFLRVISEDSLSPEYMISHVTATGYILMHTQKKATSSSELQC